MLAALVGTEAGRVPERAFQADIEGAEVEFSLERPDLRIGASAVGLTPEGRYELSALVPAADDLDTLRVRLSIRASERRYVPPLEIGGELVSGYTVPILDGVADGEICTRAGCEVIREGRAYHDHNWGTWRDVTWDWGTLRAGPYALVYGGVLENEERAGARFLFLTDSLGFRQVFDVERIAYDWSSGAAPDEAGSRPLALRLVARSGLDSLLLEARAEGVRVTEVRAGDKLPARAFFQLHGAGTLSGSLGAVSIEAEGEGFFETWGSVSEADPGAAAARAQGAAD